MKKINKIWMVLLFTSTVILNGCKKGEDDPFISLHSRKGRVAGDWKLSSGTVTDKSYDNATETTTTTTYTYDGTNQVESQTVSNSSGSSTNTNTVSYSESFSFDKSGTYTGTIVEDGITSTAEGTWNFGSGVGDKKRKSELILTATKTVNNGFTYTYTGNAATDVYYLKELRNDKMVMVMEIKYTLSNGDTGEALSEMTFIQ